MKPDTLTHLISFLKVPPEIVIWLLNAFDVNFGIENDLIKYLKECCC